MTGNEKTGRRRNLDHVGRAHLKSLVGIDDAAKVLAGRLRDVSSGFSIEDGWVKCELGGIFSPTCVELRRALFNNDNPTRFEKPDGVYFGQNAACKVASFAHRLYYEVLKRGTNIEFFQLKMEGTGRFNIQIFAETDKETSTVFADIVDFGSDGVYSSARLEVNTLPPNGSLTIHIECLTEFGHIEKIRWYGLVRRNLANMGERIYAIRTFGNLSSVSASLKSIMERLSRACPEILERTLFVVYDATGNNEGSVVADYVGNCRLLEMQGPNYGGGGNASALVSMILRAGTMSDASISEVVVFDDDAHIDAETIIRHDGFVTARKPNFIATSVVYSRRYPDHIQEFGGIWGRLFCPETLNINVNGSDDERVFIPYLVRANRNVNKDYDVRYIGRHQDVDFSTFIFISFPYEALVKHGPPLPVFLRNDDCEICLRMRAKGIKVLVNPNLAAWHDSAHNPVGEFYSIFHSLMVNARHGGLAKLFVYRFFLERITKLSTVRNLPMLLVYQHVLRQFLLGPECMSPDQIYGRYAEIRNEIGNVMANDATQIPFEVVDVLQRNGSLDLINIVEPLPIRTNNNAPVFFDSKDDTYYSFASSRLDEKATAIMEDCLASLAKLVTGFEALEAAWAAWLDNFDHTDFWDALLAKPSIKVVGNTEFKRLATVTLIKGKRAVPVGIGRSDRMIVDAESVSSDPLRHTGELSHDNANSGLPPGFDAERYYALNPDVQQAGMDAAVHWLEYGRFENRTY